MTIYEDLGAKPRIEVGAVLRVGMRDPKRGHPIDKDCFTIAEPLAVDHEFSRSGGGKFKSPGRRRHPDFEAWNALKKARRTSFRGALVYAEQEDSVIVERRALHLPRHPEHPDYLPICQCLDGETARRLVKSDKGEAKPPKGAKTETDAELTFATFACPGEKCQYALGDDPPCKRRGWLYFYPRWEEPDIMHLPQVLFRFYTGSPNSVNMILGGFEQARKMAHAAGFSIDNWAGFPFILTVAETTSRRRGRRFPLVRLTPDGTLLAWLTARRKELEDAGLEEIRLLPEGRDTEEDRALDAVTIEPPRVPSEEATLFD